MWRQLRRKLPLFLALGLGACVGSGAGEGEIGFIEGFFGGIIADEPRAALIGRDVLSAGGSAADAVVAAYFTAAVTMPGSASLGGGGVCLVHDRINSRVEAIEFLARAPGGGGRAATVAVPGNVRGMALLQARYGRLNWADLLIPAESFAREGHAISRAFARELQAAAGTLRGDAEARRIFGLDGGDVSQGRRVQQIELAAVLSVVRTRGAGEFYSGQLARQFVDAVQSAGAAMTIEDLRDYKPSLQPPIQMEIGDNSIYFPPAPSGGGVLAAQLWAAADDDDRYDDADPGQRVHLLAELSARSWADLPDALSNGADSGALVSAAAVAELVTGLDRNRRGGVVGSAEPVIDYSARGRHDGMSIVAADPRGQAVACSFSLNRPFGVDKMAPGLGILLAAPEPDARASLPSAVMVSNLNTDQVFFGAAISGAAPASLVAVALDTLRGDGDFGAAVTRPRAYSAGVSDTIVAEPGLPDGERGFLESAGYSLRAQENLGRINGFWCPDGLPRKPVCQFAADPRGHGLAVSADEQ